MSYNTMSHSPYLHTAGKITVLTTFAGVLIFAVIFLLNIGNQEFQQAKAQSQATTTVNVLNTPPQWIPGQEGRELVESSVASPTNSGTDVQWVGTAVDSNGANYYLIVCTGTSTPAPPIANSNAAPNCSPATTQWAVSTATISGTEASVATTTVDRTVTSPFAESNDWFAWVCDGDPVTPRCFGTFSTGTAATNSSPFKTNSRPGFSAYSNDSPADPGAGVTFTTTSSDDDTDGIADTVQVHVCNLADFGTGTSSTECGPGGFIASSTFAASDPSVVYTLPSIIQDQDYTAFGYVIDNHGFQAVGGEQGANATITVNNVAPTVSAANIVLNGGDDLILTNAATQTPNFTISYVVSDNNSCENASAGDEIVDYNLSVYRSGVGSSSCNGFDGGYDPNNCYTSDQATSTWNLSCAATTTVSDCTGDSDATQTWECSFPLWYVADPTDDGATTTPFSGEDWRVAVSAIDDDTASSSVTESSTADIDVRSLLAFALDTAAIPYGDLEPGNNTGTLSASTTVRATGNTGIDQSLEGESMCGTYAPGSECPVSATSTIPESEQAFGTTSLAYSTAIGLSQFVLSSTSIKELELNVPKSTSTVTQSAGTTFWGIEVPGSITLAGLYTGQNTFYAVLAETIDW